MAQAILAFIRASNVTFSNAHDRLAFAVHAAICNTGFGLVGLGDDAQLEGLAPDAPDVPVAGWDAASGERYTFLYAADGYCLPLGGGSGTAAAAVLPEGGGLLMKALALGPGLMCATLAVAAGEPQVLELDVGHYVTSDTTPSLAKAFDHLDELAAKVNTAVAEVLGGSSSGAGGQCPQPQGAHAPPAAAPAAAASPAATAPAELLGRMLPPSFPGGQAGEEQPDPLRIGPPRRPGPRVGHEDLMPMYPGELPPGWGGGGGGMPPGGFPGGGGMHVGPGHPFFGGGLRHPELQPGRGAPPGARWDPIRPQGLEGWHPDDFTHPPGPGGPGPGSGQPLPPHHGLDPDIGPPPPGRGTDWDSMFG